MLTVWDADELEGIFSFSGTDFVGFCAKKINSDDMYFWLMFIFHLTGIERGSYGGIC